MNNAAPSMSSNAPVIGVLVGRARYEKLLAQEDDFRSYFWFKELFDANQELDLTLYVFTSSNVDCDNQTVQGVYFDRNSEQWQEDTFPVPGFLYNRGVLTEQQEEMKTLLQYFDDCGVKRLNAVHLFNKWDVYKQLKKHPELKGYLPKSVRIREVADLNQMLEKYHSIYIKAYYGSRGRDVMKITRTSNGYAYSSNYLGDVSQGTKANLRQLYHVIKEKFGQKRIFAQRGIDLIRVRDQMVDFRAEVQRNKYDEIEVVAIAARIAETNSPITTHADVISFEEFWRKYFCYSGYQFVHLMNKVTDFLTTVYARTEEAYGSFVDIGIDFGIDRRGRIWLIECNARSAKISFKRIAGAQTIRQAFLNPLEYANFLYTVEQESKKQVQDEAASSTEASTEPFPESADEGESISQNDLSAANYFIDGEFTIPNYTETYVWPHIYSEKTGAYTLDGYPSISLSQRWT